MARQKPHENAGNIAWMGYYKSIDFDERRAQNLANANPEGWTKHTDYHWSRTLCGDRLDYWPSRNRFRWRGKTRTGDVEGFIRNRESES